MLVLARRQLQSFDAAAAARADRGLAEYARRRFPGVFDARTDDEMIRLAQAVRALSRQIGFEEERHVCLVLDLVVMYGRDFHRAAWAADVLALSGWSPEQRADALRARVRRRVGGF